MNARGERALERRNMRKAVEEIPAGPMKKIQVDSDTRDEDIVEEKDAVSLGIADLDVESMKKFILDYKRYSLKCLRQLLRKMQQFILEE